MADIFHNPFVILPLMVLIAFLIPAKWDPAIRIKERQMAAGWHPEAIGMKFVSWYIEPASGRCVYLADAPDGEGYIYTPFIQHAKRFDSFDAAKKSTPVYDGSAGIESRTGVERVS